MGSLYSELFLLPFEGLALPWVGRLDGHELDGPEILPVLAKVHVLAGVVLPAIAVVEEPPATPAVVQLPIAVMDEAGRALVRLVLRYGDALG